MKRCKGKLYNLLFIVLAIGILANNMIYIKGLLKDENEINHPSEKIFSSQNVLAVFYGLGKTEGFTLNQVSSVLKKPFTESYRFTIFINLYTLRSDVRRYIYLNCRIIQFNPVDIIYPFHYFW